MTKVLQPCGTWAAYQRHMQRGESPCEPCADARRAYLGRRRSGAAQVPRVPSPGKEVLNRKSRAESRQLVREYLLEHPCADCGEDDPVVLDFHHVTSKDATVSRLIGSSWARIAAEIAKCVVLCANCHRRRHASQRTEEAAPC